MSTRIPKSSKRSKPKLSDRQKRILRFISSFVRQNGYPPTIRQIGTAVDIGSTSVVNYNLNKLVMAGYLERTSSVSRGLRLVKSNDEADDLEETSVSVKVSDDINVTKVPLVGRIVASAPVMLPGDDFGYYHDHDDLIEVPSSLLGRHADSTEQIFALRVNGNSMVDALVNDRDVVILRRQETAENGDMVAVWLEDNNEMTLKYFFLEDDQVRLQPANSTMDPIYVDARQVKIQGRVLAVLRRL